jgi:predicted nuclease of restriction endonuclease-like (RecB) superfamily
MHIKTPYRFQKRQLNARRFGCAVRQAAKVSPVARLLHPSVLNEFKDTYMLELLGLQGDHSESDLRQGLLAKLKAFLGELGRDFCFVGSQFPVQVGGRDFALDLLFFHRSLNCLVAIEPHENPAIGVLLCASKDDEVVEYALSRTASPALIAQYETQLPDKALLQSKLHEFYLQNTTD